MYSEGMVCIRIFKTRKQAAWAKEILKEGNISAIISEDNFNGTPIQEYGVSARFRLKVAYKDFERSATYLAKKLKEKKLHRS